MVLEYIKRSWESYKSNFMIFIVAEIIALIIVGIIFGVGTGIIFTTMGVSSFTELVGPEIGISRIVSIFPLFLGFGIALAFYLVAAIVATLFMIGLFGMASDALRGLVELKTMFRTIKEVWLTGLLATIIIGLINSILALILIIGLNVIFPVIGSIFGTIVLLLIIVIFSLTYPAIVVDNLGPIEAIQRSINISKRYYPDIFALLLFYTIVSLALTFIPFIGQVVIYFLIMPMFFISLVFFYKRNKI